MKTETLPRFLNLLSPVLHSWDLFVQQIGVPTDKASEIQAANANSSPSWLLKCFTQAMEWWVANHSSPTYEVIMDVLETTPVMNRTLAKEVKEFMTKERGELFFNAYS